MEKNFYYQFQDTPTPNRCTLIRFAATGNIYIKNESLLRN